MPWGPARIEALKQAGLLRNEAAKKEIASVSSKKIWHHDK